VSRHLAANPLLITILHLALFVSAQAGELAPHLAELLETKAANAPVRALVVLNDQVDIRSLDQELRAAKAPLAERHEVVIRALQDLADRSQRDLLASLAVAKASGSVKGYAAHWLVNAVMVEGTPAELKALSRRDDVERLEADLLIDTLSGSEKGSGQLSAIPSGSVAWGLDSLGVPDVWHELGIDGTGQILGIMDTGVDASHSALAGSWRGNTAPAAECWLDLVESGSPDYPVDLHYKGTLQTGLMVGHANGDTMGVAPGAQWIATNFLWQASGAEFDADVITSLEFMADPDGDPATIDDMPAAVLNAWGITESNSGYFDCDSRWWAALDACEAAGPVLIFTAGDYGPGSSTMPSPADYAATETSGFSVGGTESAPPYTLMESSGSGPSGCGTEWDTKPEVVAPGEGVYTTYPGEQYVYFTSPLAAASYVTGVVALMRQAAPDADAETIKQALLNTARDQDSPGDDNNSGRGFVDAKAAVLEVMIQLGTAGGIVTDQGTGLPIAGAVLADTGSALVLVTDSAGSWERPMLAGSYIFEVTAPGFFDGSLSFSKMDGVNTVADIALATRPVYQVSGTVTGPDGLPAEGAEIRSLMPPLTSAYADATGFYSMNLPGGEGLEHHLVAWGMWAGTNAADFTLIGDYSQDFALPAKLGEDFETGDLQRYAWSSTTGDPWMVDQSLPRSGRFSVHSPDQYPGTLSNLVLEFYAAEAGQMSFDFRVYNRDAYDNFDFLMDDDLLGSWSGDLDWNNFSVFVGEGYHVFEWKQAKNSIHPGTAVVWLDNIILPPTGVEPLAVIELDVSSLEAAVAVGGMTSGVFNVTNSGNLALDIAIQPELTGKSVGGPDSWGYTWEDSDQPDGPVYDWIDITVDGIATDIGNEEMALEVDPGFPFLFYGELYDELNISSNGFLSFVSTVPAYFNRVIPFGAQPNTLIAPFWDDLNPGAGSGEVFWKSEPENGRFIVTWENVVRNGTSELETFQAILNVDGSFVFQYALVNNSSSCSVGIENADGSDGLQVAFNDAAYLHAGLAVRFNPVPPVDWVVCNPWFARVEPGTTQPMEVHFDATDLLEGVYQALLRVYSNDRTASEQTVTLQLTVAGVSAAGNALPGVPTFTGAVPNPFNPQTELRYHLPTMAKVSLKIYDLSGRQVRTLVNDWMEAGPQTSTWNGQDNTGSSVSSGRYFARLEVNGVPAIRGMTLLR
jgi:hypothetical protein